MAKSVTVFVLNRDENGEVCGSAEANGITEDEGNTVILGLGYLPALATAQPGDVKVTVHQPVVVYENVQVSSVVPNEEVGEQIITFTLG